jgi:hypothetical protein
MDRKKLRDSAELACEWLVKVAQVKTRRVVETPLAKGCPVYHYENWKGAIRNEYVAAEKRWYYFATVWHTAEAVRALVLASRAFKNRAYLKPAGDAVRFIINQQELDKAHPMYGYVWSYEDTPNIKTTPMINTESLLITAGGLMAYAEADDPALWDNIGLMLQRLADTFYIDGEGLFRSPYNRGEDKMYTNDWFTNKDNAPGRPLVEHGVFLKGYRHFRNPRFKKIFLEAADRLLRDEDPPGNWLHYSPNNPKRGTVHPRMAYWWGRPLLLAYEETKDQRYLDCARRAADFYAKALRLDGGVFRYTDITFNTESFGQATSGSACAALLWLDYQRVTGEQRYEALIERALDFCMHMQLPKARDRNLRGCILEKVNPPDGTDASPYHNRDLASSMFIQAASDYWMQKG